MMYQTLTFYHNSFRWLVLVSLLLGLIVAYKGYLAKAVFSKTDNLVRHWTATIAHIQLVIGMVLYFKSPLMQYFWTNFKTAIYDFQLMFFGLIHSLLMLFSVILITMGSALAKRQETDTAKFKTMMVWYTLAFILIFIAVPWPFSPLANRPYFR